LRFPEMPTADKLAKKQKYFDKLQDLCVNSSAALIVHVDHVTSKQMQQIRFELRTLGGTVLMGKNTMIRKALSLGHELHPETGMDVLRSNVKGNIGFIFAQTCTLDDLRDLLKRHRKSSAAKAGTISMVDLDLPTGPTGMDPSQTAFFQALNIATKIVKGQIELLSVFPILKTDQKVSASAAVLLAKLSIRPFEYGVEVKQVYQDGQVFDAAVLDIGNDVLIQKFLNGVANMAAFSREIGIPTEAGLPHMFGNAFRNIASLVADIDFTFKEVEPVKAFLADPEAYAAANPSGGGGGGGGGGGKAAAGGKAAPAAAAAVEEEEEDEGADFDLFG